jgi:excinuclease ABC subunit C
LPYNGTSLRLMRQIRDEVHRFGIGFHRKKRAQGTFRNELENIRGIGDSTADTLLKTFRSVNNIATATEEELEKQIGKSKARLVWKHFHKNLAENGMNSTDQPQKN